MARPDTAAVDHDLEEAAPSVSVRRIFQRFWPDLRPFRYQALITLILVLVGPMLGAAAIWLFKVLVDRVLTPRDFGLFPWIAGIYVAITLAIGGAAYAEEYLSAWVGENFLHGLRTRVFSHLQILSLGFFERRKMGDTLSRLTSDVGAVEGLLLSGVAQTLANLAKIGLFIGVMCYISVPLTLAALLVVPFFWFVARVFARKIRVASRQVRMRAGSMSTAAEESLGNIALIQAYGLRRAAVERFSRQSRGSVAAELSVTKLRALFALLIDLLEVLGVLAIIGVGVWELSDNSLSLGGLLAFLIYLSQLFEPVRGLGRLSNMVFAAAAGAERIIDLLDQKPWVSAPARAVRPSRVRGELRMDAVSFRYPDTTRDALVDIDFSASPGRHLALVGPSGAGKSTVTKLLLRFYDPTVGAITVDGHDLRTLDPDYLRANMALVMQETLLFDGTVADNIQAGRARASHRDIVAAARAADADEFISALPDGYDTRVGQRGRLLSGGQRQRIAIARAMIRDVPIVILDEPTVGIDAEAARRILAPLRRLMAGRTTIVISHNLLTVAEADQILFLQHGRVTEVGTHSQLLSRNDGYAHLYNLHRPPAGTELAM